MSLTASFGTLSSFFVVSEMKSSIHKRQYHPYIPLAFHLRILPEKLTQQLPRSTKHYWRKKDLQQLTGYELAIEQQSTLNTLSVIASNKHLLTINKVLIKIIALSRYISKNIQGIRAGRTPIVNCFIKQVNSISPVMGLRKTLHWCKFSYAQWRRLLNKQLCARSPFQLCRRKHPAQLLNQEINVLTNTCIDPAYAAWPLSSVYHHLVRTGQLYCSLSSFYKYCAKLVSRPSLSLSRRKNHSTGIRAENPLQILHADITLFRNTDGALSYIYFIQDNHSRSILQYAVSDQKKASTLIELIRKVYHQYLLPSSSAFVLLTDGGTENQSVSKHFADTLPPLEHLIAQKDIIFSNAMIEHLNKTIKYRYLYQQPIHNRQHLEKILEQAVLNYNNRPVHILQGLTPLEVLHHHAPDLPNIKENIQKALKNRININKAGDCCI